MTIKNGKDQSAETVPRETSAGRDTFGVAVQEESAALGERCADIVSADELLGTLGPR